MKPDECKKLRGALDKVLDKIGPTFKQGVYEDLEKANISFDYPCSSIQDIEKALQRYFGYDGTLLLIQAIRKHMEAE
ncbi:MAG TPA: hypothetical protein VHA09_08835 [Nitrososphaera sp.]|nr:hypothetical protein [Nitrososphaera sp.]